MVSDIYSHYERTAKDWRRPHLGASLMGHECRRFLWFSFRWTLAPSFPGRVLRLFDTGNLEEGRLVKDLRNAGIEVYDRDGSEQFHVTISPHSGGSLDGIGRGFAESPNKWHVLEFKTHNQKSFDILNTQGVQKAKPLHFVQMQIYMLKMSQLYPGQFDRAFYFAVNKNTDEIYAERVKLDHMEAQRHVGKALSVIESNTPAPRAYDDPRAPDCIFCPYHGLCFTIDNKNGSEWREIEGKWQFTPFSRDRLERNCRTCLHSTPGDTGVWTCERGIVADNKTGCSEHLFVPDLLFPWKVINADREGDWVEYDCGKNIKGGRIDEQN